ncbi:protein of unknown function [Magnetospirillum sp. XM-1]|uniref:hypothetical protein n=1 Tax=Magnetospirillum sp. XM-1 TaxID=1663591 RepID=UPI00073DDE61|nr:hypothetical protein [Magnetospirillum sp. XM-1]CUW39898.1 protein of unknown function [Magnetospirillum sp. XM-1]
MNPKQNTEVQGEVGTTTITLEHDETSTNLPVTREEINGGIVSDDRNRPHLEDGDTAAMEAELARTTALRFNMADGSLNQSWDTTTDQTGDHLATDTSTSALATGMPDNGENIDPMALLKKMLHDRNIIKGKRKALKKAVRQMAADLASFITATGGDIAIIRAMVEAAGLKWPENNAKFSTTRPLVQAMMFEGEDPTEVQNRISEWSKVVTICCKLGHLTVEAVTDFLDRNHGVKGVCSDFDEEGHRKPKDKEVCENAGNGERPASGTTQRAIACDAVVVEKVEGDGVATGKPSRTLSLTAELDAAKREFAELEAVGNRANSTLQQVEQQAEAQTEVERTKNHTRLQAEIAAATADAKKAAESAQPAQQKVKLLTKMERLPIWAAATISEGTLPDRSVFPDAPIHHLHFSVLLVHDNGEGFIEVIANVTPNLAQFMNVAEMLDVKRG